MSNFDLTRKVMSGEIDGSEVWVCHYNRPDLNKKPLRNIPPTRCLVVPNSELKPGKTIYYSESHYRPIGKNGRATAKVISPVDNTGYRTYCGNMLYTFDNEKECAEEWNKQVNAVMDIWIEERKTALKVIDNEIQALKDKIE